MSSHNNAIYRLSEQSEVDYQDFRGTPERNLMMAMLERAILDFVGTDRRESELASDWISDTEFEAPFSFAWICKELDLDPEKVSNDIKCLPKRTNHHVAPWYQKNQESRQAA
jgi:hypothetical protein